MPKNASVLYFLEFINECMQKAGDENTLVP